MAEIDQVTTCLAPTNAEVNALCEALQITPEQRSGFLMRMNNEAWVNLDGAREEYLGFDAKVIIATFFAKAKEQLAPAGSVPTLAVGTLRLHEQCPATDLAFLLTLFLERGNNLSKALLRCDAEVSAVIKRKCSQYGISIEKRANANILGTATVTLARLAQAFSAATASIILSRDFQGKLRSKLFATPLSVIMQHSIFAGLIPTNLAITEDLKLIAVILNSETSILLATPKEKRKMANRSLEDLMEDAQMYVEAAMNGSAMPEVHRAKVLIKAGVLVKARGDGRDTVVASNDTKLMIAELADIRRVTMRTYTQAQIELKDIREGALAAERAVAGGAAQGQGND